jgi:sulfotransferase family protein
MTLPNFLIIGAQKAGTTALYAYLEQHPDVFASEIKEPGFFAFEGQEASFAGPQDALGERSRVRDLARYQALFRTAQGHRLIGEGSNVYLYVPQAPRRILHYVPKAKLIAVLRNPVDRAYSAYRHLVRDGREPLASFEEALEAEQSRIAANWHPHWHYQRRGFYHEQLQRYFDCFDRRQIAVYTYDDFVANPLTVMRSIFGFLGVDDSFVPDMRQRHNVSGVPRLARLHAALARPSALKDFVKRLIPAAPRQRLRAAIMERNIVAREPKLSSATRHRLTDLYREDVLRVEGLIGKDLSAWRTVPAHRP